MLENWQQILLKKIYCSFYDITYEQFTRIEFSATGSSEIVGETKNAPKRGMVLPFQPLSLEFNHVNYYVDMPVVSHSFETLNPFKFS